MFEAILARGAPKKEVALGIAIALVVHVAVACMVVAMSGTMRSAAGGVPDLVVTFQQRPAGAARPGVAARPASSAAVDPVREVARPGGPNAWRRAAAHRSRDEVALLAEGASDATALANGAEVGSGANVASGAEGGNGAAAFGGTETATASERTGMAQGPAPVAGVRVIPFGEGMTQPSLVSKIDPIYTREAIEAKVEGLMLIKCVITTLGTLERCRVLKGLPHLNEVVLASLSKWRFKPISYQGQVLDVEYTIPVRMTLP